MLPVFELRVVIDPVAKERPRFNRKTGSSYTPKRTAQYEKDLARAFKAAGAVPRDESEDLEIHCQFGVVGNRRKDIDNLQKCVLDAGNAGVLYADDKQVVRLRGEVEYGVAEGYVALQVFSLGSRAPSNARSRPRRKKPLVEDCACGQDHLEMLTDPEAGDLLCVEHKRHRPCRPCMYAAAPVPPTGYDTCFCGRIKPTIARTCWSCR
ncbi:hypothetical protein GCM10028801_30940 [Nocardioides maradonensis]